MVATVSGNIDVDEVDDAEVKTVSGNISLGARGGGRLAARSISGSVEVSVPDGSRPATRLKAVSGQVRCDCEPGRRRRGPGQERERVDLGHMPVTTVTGTIVFTDIVGFTQLTDEHGDDLALDDARTAGGARARARCPTAARVVKELGDGLLLWFDDPRRRDRRRRSRSSTRSRTSPTATCRCGCASGCTGAARGRAATTSSAAT